jgi:hypothetical protein
MPYVDQGAQVSGDVWFHDKLQLWYGAYVVNGFRSGIAQEFNFMDQTATTSLSDNNHSMSYGGRLTLAQGSYAAGVSWMQGDYDPQAAYGYRVWGVDASANVLKSQLRAEYLERSTDVALDAGRGTLEKKGFYGQLEVPVVPTLMLVGRLDGLLREGPPLGTDNDESSGIFRWSAGVNVAPAPDYSLRVQYEHWRFTDFADADAVHLGVVVTY